MMEFAGLRIALVGPLPPPAGGMANQTRQLAELLRGEGAKVEIVQTNAAYRPAWVGRWLGVRAMFRLVPYLLDLWRVIGRSDLVHVMANSGWSWHLFAAPAIWIGVLRGRAVIVNYRGGEAGAFLDRSVRTVGVSLRRAAALIVPSGFLLAEFSRHGFGPEVVANVIDLQRFRPGQKVRSDIHLLVARNLELLYDNASVIQAFALIRSSYPEARLTIAGTGPEAGSLRRLAEDLGVDEGVQFVGRVERDEMAELVRSSTVSINPSLADNMPNSILEALASGVPVVSTNVGGVPYLVQNERTALLVPPRDPRAIADAVLRLVDDPALYQHLRMTGMEEVKRYTWTSIGPQLGGVYRRCLNRSKTGEHSRGKA